MNLAGKAREEFYQAELNLVTAKSLLQNAEVSFENAKDQLKLYLGMDLYQDFSILANVAVNPVEVDLEKAIESGLDCEWNCASGKLMLNPASLI